MAFDDEMCSMYVKEEREKWVKLLNEGWKDIRVCMRIRGWQRCIQYVKMKLLEEWTVERRWQETIFISCADRMWASFVYQLFSYLAR